MKITGLMIQEILKIFFHLIMIIYWKLIEKDSIYKYKEILIILKLLVNLNYLIDLLHIIKKK